MYKDKRRHLREKMVAEVFYKDEKKQSFGGCVAKNVSEGGVCIHIGEFVPLGCTSSALFRHNFFLQQEALRLN
jgi:hypothetical protein